MKEFINTHDDHMEIAFDKYKKTHDRKYKNIKEHHRAKENFRQNLR